MNFLDISDHRSPINIGKADLSNFLLGIKHFCQCLFRLVFNQPDIVYLGISQGMWGYLRDLSFAIPAALTGRRLILHLRGSEFRLFYDQMPAWLRWVTRRIMARTARVIVLGRCLEKLFVGLVNPAKIAVIPNGIAYQRFSRPKPQMLAPSPTRRLLYLSSLQKRKGIFVLLQALPNVLARFSDAELTVAGLWQNQAEKAEAESLINNLRLKSKVNFIGEVTGERKVRLLHESDLLVFTPVEPEGLPWVILEAMSASLPVVTADQGAIAEVVEHARTGLIVPAIHQKVADAICELLENPAAALAMGQSGRKRVEEHFSEELYLRRLTALFREVIGQRTTVEKLALPPRESVAG